MLYFLARWLGFPGVLNLVRYQSFRTGAAVATALFVGLLIGPRFIGWLRVRQGKGQPIRPDGPQTHLAKRGTPTMGGLMILTSMAIAILIWMDLTNPLRLGVPVRDAGIRRDRLPRRLRQGEEARATAGVSGRTRLIGEFVIAGLAAWIIMQEDGTRLYLPFADRTYLELGWGFPVFAAFTIVAFGNAVNLTDGLDGLATMPVIIAAVAFIRDRVPGRQREVRRLSGHSACAARGRAGDLLRRDRGRGARLPVVQRAAGGRVHGRHGQPRARRRAGRRSRWWRITRSCWGSSAACSSSRR